MNTVLGSRTRLFKQVFDAANGQLLDVFGMQMVELPVREKVTIQQKRGMFYSFLSPHTQTDSKQLPPPQRPRIKPATNGCCATSCPTGSVLQTL
jgi:hypothetical protein